MQIQKIDKIQIVQNKTQMQKEVDNNCISYRPSKDEKTYTLMVDEFIKKLHDEINKKGE